MNQDQVIFNQRKCEGRMMVLDQTLLPRLNDVLASSSSAESCRISQVSALE